MTLFSQLSSQDSRDRILISLAIATAAMLNLSIAGTEILLALSSLLLIVWGRFAFPARIWIPLALFFGWTLLADACSADPWGAWPYVKKFFDYLFIPLLYATFRRQFDKVRYLVWAWTATAAASGIWALVQYVRKYDHAKHIGADFYVTYLERRITGFQGHWMMFGALQLGALTLLVAHGLFARRRMPLWVYPVSAAISLAGILLSWDRSIWLATVPVVVYLVAVWRPKLVALVPVAAVLLFFVSPHSTRERVESLFKPHGDTDSNRFRIVTFRTGVAMIEAHPLLGLGPDQVAPQFQRYVPADVRRPLPVGFYGHLHNVYVEFAAERGIPALVFLLLFIGMVVRDCARALWGRRQGGLDDERVFVLHAAIGVVIGILVGGLFEHNLGDSEVLMMFLCVVGLAYAAMDAADVRVGRTG